MRRALALVVLAPLIGLAACGEDGAAATVDAAPSDPTPRFDDGLMHIDISSQTFGGGMGATSIVAMLSPTPAPWPYDAPTAAGACRMFRRHDTTNCTPACDFRATCDDGTCQPLPVSQSAGIITLTGGGARARVPFDGSYQLYLSTALFAAGTDITATAPGDVLPGFTLTARLPAPLTLVGTDQLRLAAGTPLTLRWTPSADGGANDERIRVTLGADLGHAQWRTVVIECDLPDAAGAVTIPQAMTDVLADRRNWGCGDCFGHELRRYRRADTILAGTTLTLWTSQAAPLYLVPDR